MTRLQVSSLVLVRSNTQDIHSAGEMREELYQFTASDTWLGGGGATCVRQIGSYRGSGYGPERLPSERRGLLIVLVD
jgi:hypothetical protein